MSYYMTIICHSSTLLYQTVIGGFLIDPEFDDQLVHIFPRVVSNVLRYVLASKTVRGAAPVGVGGHGSDRIDESIHVSETIKRQFSRVGNHQIVQWSRGARIIRDQTLYAELRLTEDGRSMTVVCWGPGDRGRDLFFFQVGYVYILSLLPCRPKFHRLVAMSWLLPAVVNNLIGHLQ